jgi:hypothetical protein
MVEVKSIFDMICEVSPYYAKKKEKKEKGLIKDITESEHTLVYESSSEQLEPIYFFLLDFMNDLGLSPEKLIDNFSSSVGSGHFGELGQRASIMQQNGTKLLGDINNVLRSVLNLIYDLREFKIRLQLYDDLKNSATKEAAILGLKQLWLDKVDMQKGNSSIKAMALGQGGFTTLLDAFLAVKDLKDAEKLDLNERVKRLILHRLNEFNIWLEQSEKELRKRYEIEKTYLRSQVNSLKIYSQWAKPYLRAAHELEMKEQYGNPALVKAFNTIILEMSLLGKKEIKVKDLAVEETFPKEFAKDRFLKKFKRKYYACVLLDFNFRGIPQKIGQQSTYTFGGRTEVSFKAFALNDQEIVMLKKKLEDSDIDSALGLIQGVTDESLGQLKEDIEFFLGEEESKKQESTDKSNPFSALFGFYEKKSEVQKEKSKETKKMEQIKSDDWYEKTFFRTKAAEIAEKTLFTVFDIYKKAHGMPSYD